jgi:hypothetical protein
MILLVAVLLSLPLLGAALLLWRAVFRVDLGALDRSRKAERVVITEAVAMLAAGAGARDVAAFLSDGLKATALPGDTQPNPW